MKIALIHDYIKEFGGAERVLEVLSEMYPEAPIYTAFCDKNSTAYHHFKNRNIISSWFGYIPFAAQLASPLRFLTPFIWGSFSFSKYDLVISSASWYITKGFGTPAGKPIEICYCHTPPRWLYGYTTSVNFQKYPLIKIYAALVGHVLRLYDFSRAQKVNVFLANSKEVQARIEKFYRRESTVVYPPVALQRAKSKEQRVKGDYYLIVSRLVGAKGIELAIEAAVKMEIKLKIAGATTGYYDSQSLKSNAKGKVEFLGHVTDEELVKLYTRAKGFFALAKDEDFGITPVEAMLCGTGVIAYNAAGYKETVVDGKTGVLFDDYSVEGLIGAIKKFEKLKIKEDVCITQAKKFSKKNFEKKIKQIVRNYA